MTDQTAKMESILRSADEAFKELIHEKDILAWTAKAAVDEFKNLDVEVIKDMICEDGCKVLGLSEEPNLLGAGRIRLDNLFGFKYPDGKKIGLLLNVESQNRRNPGYPLDLRALYYVTRLFAFQDPRGNYEDLKSVYSVWIMPRSCDDGIVHINTYAMRNVEGPAQPQLEHGDRMKLVFVHLPRKYRARKANPLAFLTLMFSDTSIKEDRLIDILSNKYKISTPDLFKWRGKFMNSFAEDISEYYKYQGFELGKAEGKAESEESFAKILSEHILSRGPRDMEEARTILAEFNISAELYSMTLAELRKSLDTH